MTEFHLISGFLGSGKTTLIKNILDEFSDRNRIAVIQNEFAPTGVDGQDLKDSGKDFKLIEINNGSVFCICQLGNFVDKLNLLIEKYRPEMIFLESSGLSDPVNILEVIQSDNLNEKLNLSGIITIVDSVNFNKGIKTLARVKHQIMIADVILLNKIDIYKGDFALLQQEIKEINPFAEIVKTNFCNISMDLLISDKYHVHKAAGRFRGMSSEGRPKIYTSVLRLNEKISGENLEPFLDEIQEKSIRVKGRINLAEGTSIAIQTVYDQRNLVEIDHHPFPSELIAFSDTLDIKELRSIFKKFSAL